MTEKKSSSLVSIAKTNWNDPASKTREGLLKIIDNSFEDYEQSVQLSEREAGKLSNHLKKLSTGAAGFILLNCKGAECPFSDRCPLVQMRDDIDSDYRHGKAPLNQNCLLEATILRDSISSYLQEYQVDPVNYTEVNIVSELAEIEVLLWRINMQLGDGTSSLLIIDQTIGFDKSSGKAITQQQVAPLFEQKQKLANRKSKLMKLMVGDRQEKYKREAALKQKPDTDASSQMSEIKKVLQTLQFKTKEANNQMIIDAEVVSPEDLMRQAAEEIPEFKKPINTSDPVKPEEPKQ